jgi:hypothetical protein
MLPALEGKPLLTWFWFVICSLFLAIFASRQGILPKIRVLAGETFAILCDGTENSLYSFISIPMRQLNIDPSDISILPSSIWICKAKLYKCYAFSHQPFETLIQLEQEEIWLWEFISALCGEVGWWDVENVMILLVEQGFNFWSLLSRLD